MTSQLNKVAKIIASKYEVLNVASKESIVPVIVGIAGGVSVGKSTFANHIRSELEKDGLSSVVVSGDSFLMSNAVLESKGWSQRKGFPETYYEDDVRNFLHKVRAYDNPEPITIPIYDHVIYDIRPGNERQVVPKAAVVLFEGITALRFADQLDLGIYLDAEEEDTRQWYITRWTNYREEIRLNPSEFFKPLMHLDEAGFLKLLEDFWVNLNLPNLKQYIEPTRQAANLIVKKSASHEIEDIVVVR